MHLIKLLIARIEKKTNIKSIGLAEKCISLEKIWWDSGIFKCQWKKKHKHQKSNHQINLTIIYRLKIAGKKSYFFFSFGQKAWLKIQFVVGKQEKIIITWGGNSKEKGKLSFSLIISSSFYRQYFSLFLHAKCEK